jgi:hypothetical protein
MKLTVLVDNNTFIDRYFLGEPGVSYFIEAEEKKILFDVGYSDAFIFELQNRAITGGRSQGSGCRPDTRIPGIESSQAICPLG